MKGIEWKCLGLHFFFLRSDLFILVKVVIKKKLEKLAVAKWGI